MAQLIIWSNVAIEYSPVRSGGAYQVASWLRKHGYTVKVIDFCHLMTTDELVAITEKNIGTETIAIGISSTFWTPNLWHPDFSGFLEPQWVLDAREKLEKNYKKYWLLGGHRSRLHPYKYEWVRFSGFAEDSILQWMDQNTNKFVHRELFDIASLEKHMTKDDFIQPYEPLTIELTRGCKFKCKFCNFPLMGKKPGTYMRDPKFIREEFIRNYNEYGTTRYYFQDDTVNESMEKVQSIADIAQSLPFKMEWVGYSRLDLIGANPGMNQALKDSGLRSVQFGIETFRQDTASLIGKGWNAKYAKDYLLELREFWGTDISWYLSFIIGLPFETKEDILSTHQWCIDTNMYDWSFFGLNINNYQEKYWRSEFDKNCESYGYKFPNPKDFNYWENDLWTSKTALELSIELNEYPKKKGRPSAWLLGEIGTLGYSFEELMHVPREQHNWNNYRLQTKEFVHRYVMYQLASTS